MLRQNIDQTQSVQERDDEPNAPFSFFVIGDTDVEIGHQSNLQQYESAPSATRRAFRGQ